MRDRAMLGPRLWEPIAKTMRQTIKHATAALKAGASSREDTEGTSYTLEARRQRTA